MKRTIIILTAFILFFILWYFNLAVWPFKAIIGDYISVHYSVNYIISGLIPLAAMFILHKRGEILSEWGLSHGFFIGIIFAILCTLPMLIGYACIGSIGNNTTTDRIITYVLVAGVFEEVIFRGFVFGQLFRCACWGFIPSALLTAVVFGSLHLYQGHDILSALGSFGVTALGSLLFSWIYVEWNYNLWTVIWLHTLMNLPWIVFSVSTTGAVGSIMPNTLRICTIITAIGLTILPKKHFGLPYYVNRKNLITNA